jgi:tetratricopeptide (TPR) repeat protein
MLHGDASSRRGLRAWAFAACVGAAATAVGAPRPAWAEATSPAKEAAARRHFERARDYYAQGSYRDAIAELEAAHALDPNAKDLVFNLGVVHEKLGHIEEALTWSRLYATMDLTPAEREKADAYVHRLEGAKKELEEDRPAPDTSAVAPVVSPPPPPSPPPERPSGSRMNALAAGLGGVSIAALAFGVVLAVKAEQDRPPSPFITGRDGTYADLADRQANAHREAIMADIGFGGAAAAAAATVVLLVARIRDRADVQASTHLSAVSFGGGGGVVVQGGF